MDQTDELLEVLLTAEDEDRPVAAGDLGDAVDGLVDGGAVQLRDGEVVLTDAGRHRAERVVRRHRLAERMLRDVVGLDWRKVHREAAGFELAISDEVEAHLIELLGDPGTCPHGNPIPGSANRPDQSDAVRLADAPEGPVEVVRIDEELEEDDEALALLERCGFIPGRPAEVAGRNGTGVKVVGPIADAEIPPHVAALTFVRPR